ASTAPAVAWPLGYAVAPPGLSAHGCRFLFSLYGRGREYSFLKTPVTAETLFDTWSTKGSTAVISSGVRIPEGVKSDLKSGIGMLAATEHCSGVRVACHWNSVLKSCWSPGEPGAGGGATSKSEADMLCQAADTGAQASRQRARRAVNWRMKEGWGNSRPSGRVQRPRRRAAPKSVCYDIAGNDLRRFLRRPLEHRGAQRRPRFLRGPRRGGLQLLRRPRRLRRRPERLPGPHPGLAQPLHHRRQPRPGRRR